MNQTGKVNALVIIGLLIATVVAFEDVRECDFVYDDTMFIVQNPYVHMGLSPESMSWALTAYHTGNWHPLTWLSHFLDYSLFGMNPVGHHVVNLLLHVVNALLLFWVFRRMTGSVWASAFVAAVFAVHPLRVESVAWVSERKDVLGGTFWMLTLLAYLRYVERPAVGRYLIVAAMFALGLMSKPMLVTLPFVLLLLDYWPLDRVAVSRSPARGGAGRRRRPIRSLIVEKIPLLLLVAAVIAVTLDAQRSQGGLAMMQTGELSLGLRLGNAAVSYVSYLLKIVYPVGLAVFYPHPKESLAIGHVALSLVFLIVVSMGVILAARRGHRYALVGWLWYLGVLLPVIGVVQTGGYALADRYSYVPSIGFLIMIAWGAAAVLDKRPQLRTAAAVVAAVVLVVLIAVTRNQVGYWRNGTTLYTHAINVTDDNHVAYYNLARIELLEGKIDSAVRHLEETVRLVPDSPDARTNLGIALTSKQRYEEATEHLRIALDLDPHSAKANNNYGQALAMAGRLDESAPYFEKAIQLDPGYAKAHYNLAYIRSTQGRYDEALRHCDSALRIQPNLAAAVELRKVLLRQHGASQSAP